ncbi:MAG: MobA/MobL family protein [Firmicutes bacterium]|nr:MobA/MobL family protein [Bacillota bacterium]
MAIYHFDAKVITRGIGRSVCAAAAYASCSQIYNDYDGVQHDYTKKHGSLYSEIFLPPNAPQEWQNRETLWNAVEAAEKSKDSRLARELIVALPVELGIDDWIAMLKNFVTEQCVDKGMCADVNIHDTDGHNPHAHILLTVRPLDEKGKWQSKTQKEYLCKRGDEERGFTAAEFKTAQADGWEKQYQYKVGKKKVYLTPSKAEKQKLERVSKNPKSTRFGRQNPIAAEWNSEEQILIWRKAWEDVTNKALKQKKIDERVDCRSFKERGIDEQPTIHEGVAARIMEKRGIVSERCELNRQIKADNKILRELKALVAKLTEAVKNTVPVIAEKLESIRSNLIINRYQLKFNNSQLEQIGEQKKAVSSLLQRYDRLKKNLHTKHSRLKKLKAEKQACSPINFIKHNQIDNQIGELTADIKNLNLQIADILRELDCADESELTVVKNTLNRNSETADKLKSRNDVLTAETEAEKSRYAEVREAIPPEDSEAVRSERRSIRGGVIAKAARLLQSTYGRKYSGDMLTDVENEIDTDINEKPFEKRSLREQLKKQPHDVRNENEDKRREYER